jgi:transposase
MGRSRGGLTTKIHALADRHGRPLRLALTPGQTHDGQAAAELLAELCEGAVVLADKAYDADAIRALIEAQGAAPNIPARSTRKARFCFSRRLYKARNRIERLFNKLKQFRRIATRYDKLAATFTAMIKLACVRLWLRGYESTA